MTPQSPPTAPPTLPPERTMLVGTLLRVLGPRLRAAMRDDYGTDGSCVAAVRIGIEALARLNLHARPLRVQVAAFNGAFMKLAQRYGRFPESAAERQEWHRTTGAHSLGLGFPVEERDPLRYQDSTNFDPTGLHLAAVVDGYWLWDPSLDQANRPQHSMSLGPLVTHAPLLFLAGIDSLRLQRHDGTVLHYEVRCGTADNRSYEQSPNWGERDARTRQAIATRVLRDRTVRLAAQSLATTMEGAS